MAAVGRLSRDWADTIDMATMHPEAWRRVAPLGRSTRWKDAEITRIRVWNGGVREVDSHAKPRIRDALDG
jgi:hypothetical protein